MQLAYCWTIYSRYKTYAHAHAHGYGIYEHMYASSIRRILSLYYRIVCLHIKGKKKVFFYIAQYPVRWNSSKRFKLVVLPGRPVQSDTNSASARSILVRQQLRANTKSLTFPTLSIARYSFIQLSRLGRQWRERKGPIFETAAKGIRTRDLSIASPAFYH